MAKIVYLLPILGINEDEIERREKLANSFLADERNQIIIESVDEGALSIESTVEEYVSAVAVLKKFITIQDKYDAAVIGCAMDAGVEPTREVANIPIVGPLESSLHVASMLGERFSVITMLDSMVPPTWRKLRAYWMDHKCTSVHAINFPVLELVHNKEKATKIFLQEIERIVMHDMCSSVLCGCMALAFLLCD